MVRATARRLWVGKSAAGNIPLGYVLNAVFWQVELSCSSSHADELSAGVGSSLGRQHLC